ncbi:MAG: tetraacyldisaccharide 4'-kinase [bacterium]|nr:tetraacyldisaccharide 4'-kinase [bacterium]
MRIWIHKLEAAWRKHAYERSSISFNVIGAPLSLIYWFLSNLKRLIFWKIPGNQIRVSNRVISVGNLTVGGSGKTPVVKYCLELLKNRSVCLISRGYGAQFQGSFARYDGKTKKWDREGKFGDEVHEVLRLYPSINAAVGKQRALLALEQEKIESNRILLYDDALQYWRLARDVDIVVIHAQKWLGNGYGFPRGPLREGPKALQRATAVIITHPKNPTEYYQSKLRQLNFHGPVFCLKSELLLFDHNQQIVTKSPRKLLACTGIAFPEQFFDDLKNAGHDILMTKSFADHHQFSEHDMLQLTNQINISCAEGVVITEKDFSRWPGIQDIPTYVARQKLNCEDSETLFNLLINP